MAVLQLFAVLAAALFAGAAIYVNVAEHPARMECGTQLAATEFGPSYRRGALMQGSLAMIGAVGGIGAWFLGASRLWLIGAVLIFAAVPFTLIVIMPINKQLLDPALDRTSERTRRLLQDWGVLHAIRSLLSLASTLVFLSTLLWP